MRDCSQRETLSVQKSERFFWRAGRKSFAVSIFVHNTGHLRTECLTMMVSDQALWCSGDPIAAWQICAGEGKGMMVAEKCGTGSVERAFMILEFLNASNRGWNISEMSRKLNIPKSTTHVLVSTLGQLGYIKQAQSSRRFQLSTKMFGLGRRALNAMPLPEAALPHLRALVQETQLTAHVGILEKNQVVFVQKADGPGFIKFDTYIGKCSELHCTGLGKALLA